MKAIILADLIKYLYDEDNFVKMNNIAPATMYDVIINQYYRVYNGKRC